MKATRSLSVVAFMIAGLSVQAQANSLGNSKAANKLAAKLAGHTFLALPSEDDQNLNDSYEDSALVRKIVFGADGSVAYTSVDRDDFKIDDKTALAASSFPADIVGTWSIKQNRCGQVDCVPVLVITANDGKSFSNEIAINAKGDLAVSAFHSNSVLHVVQ